MACARVMRGTNSVENKSDLAIDGGLQILRRIQRSHESDNDASCLQQLLVASVWSIHYRQQIGCTQ